MNKVREIQIKGNMIYNIEGVIGDYLDDYSSEDLPYKDIRGLAEYLVEYLVAVNFCPEKALAE